MLRGMTGHASIRFSMDTFDAEMEIRSFNSRYLDLRVKTPFAYANFEVGARRIISERLGRGKIELILRIIEKPGMKKMSLFNVELAKEYLVAGRSFAEETGISSEISLKEVLSLPNILNTDTQEIDSNVFNLLLKKLELLIDDMLPMMIKEGESTLVDINQSLTIMESALSVIKRRYPDVIQKYKEALKERVLEITSTDPVDERLAVEIEIFASRTAINEEVVRLRNHIDVMKEILSGVRKGFSKELDFIAQEMHRETNTIGSKSSDFEITEQTIILKSEIEKMREQFRNVV